MGLQDSTIAPKSGVISDTESCCLGKELPWVKKLKYPPEIGGGTRPKTRVAMMENQDLRRKGVHSWILTFDATNVPLDGHSIE